jgi:hypothetical protein
LSIASSTSSLALAAAVEVVEFRDRHAVVDLNAVAFSEPSPVIAQSPVDPGRRLLRDAADPRQQVGMLVMQDLGRAAA